MEIALLIGSASILAGAINAVCGFGSGPVMMMILPYFFDLVKSPAYSSVICMGVTLALFWKFRSYANWKLSVFPAVVYTLFSTTIIRYVKQMNLDGLNIAFGLFLIVLSIYFFVFSKRIKIEANWKTAVFCSAASGITSGFFGIGGPLMGIYFISATNSKEEYMGTSQLLFTFTAFANLFTRVTSGIYTVDMIPLTILGIICINIGKIFGLKILRRLDAESMKKVVYAFVGVSGAIKIVQELI